LAVRWSGCTRQDKARRADMVRGGIHARGRHLIRDFRPAFHLTKEYIVR
jgi:hypothetical protein